MGDEEEEEEESGETFNRWVMRDNIINLRSFIYL
jgi:hypothetical protein